MWGGKKKKNKTKEKKKHWRKKKTFFKYALLEKIAFGHVLIESEKIFPWLKKKKKKNHQQQRSIQVAIKIVFDK